jgi:hypothetical protein
MMTTSAGQEDLQAVFEAQTKIQIRALSFDKRKIMPDKTKITIREISFNDEIHL